MDLDELTKVLVPAIETVVRKVLKERSQPVNEEERRQPSYLKKREVAKMFAVSLRSVDRMEERGEIPRRRNIGGRRVRWLRHECEEAALRKPEGVGGAPLPCAETRGSRRRESRCRRGRGRNGR